MTEIVEYLRKKNNVLTTVIRKRKVNTYKNGHCQYMFKQQQKTSLSPKHFLYAPFFLLENCAFLKSEIIL